MSQSFIIWAQLRNTLRRFACAAILLCPLLAQAESVGVLYPQTREPYDQIYAKIVEGIRAEYKQDVRQLSVTENTSQASVQHWLDREKIAALVVLGNKTLTYLPDTNERPLVVGGAILAPGSGQLPGITVNPSPALLFTGLVALTPTVTDIHVIYEDEYNGWIITEALEAADSLGLTLHRHAVSGLPESAAKYREVQQRLDRETEALWLPLGGPSREKSILQTILQTAWSRDQIVVSSNLADVRRGALYALYPNNLAMGFELARLLKAQSEPGGSQAGPAFLSSTFQAINLRTAEHLGLRLTKDDLRKFEFVYPPQ